MDYQAADIRELVEKALTTEQLKDLLFDDFRAVYDNTEEKSRADKIRSLVDYAERQGKFPKLLENIQKLNRKVYQEFETRISLKGLIQILTSINFNTVVSIYRLSLPEISHRKIPTTLEYLVKRVADIPGQPDEIKPLWRFVNSLIKDKSINSDYQQSLKDWAEDQKIPLDIFEVLGLQGNMGDDWKLVIRQGSDRPQPLPNLQNIPTPESSPELTTLEFIGRDRPQLSINQTTSEDIKESRLPDFVQSNVKINQEAESNLSIPKVFNAPLRNQLFTGRERQIQTIHTDFISTNPLRRIQVLTAAGGYGKTQIAVEYTYRYKEEYRIVWWIRSETVSSLALDYANLADQLDLPEQKADDQQIKINAVKRFLENNCCWLLIFDNAEDPNSLEDFIPCNESGHILITSQKRSIWLSMAQIQEVPTFLVDESVNLLLSNNKHENQEIVEQLAEELGNLPLAVAQASAYIFKTGCSIKSYLDLFKKHSKALLLKPIDHSAYPHTVATTWQISFQTIESISPLAITLLNMCAFLSPENIPIDLFLVKDDDKLSEENTEIFSCPVALEDAIATLKDFSLIEREEDLLSLHRLVQMVTINRISKPTQIKLVEDLLHQLKKHLLFDYYDKNIWSTIQKYLPHGIVAIYHANNLEIVNSNLIIIQSNIGKYLVCCGRINEAELYLTASIENTEKLIQRQHFLCKELDYLLIESYHYFSSVYQEKNQLEKMVDCHIREVDLCVKLYGENHSRTISARRCLGCSYIHKGDLEVGEKIVLQSIELSKTRDKDISIEGFLAYSNTLLGVVMSKRQQWHQALSFYKLAETQFPNAGLNEIHHEPGVLFLTGRQKMWEV